MQPALSRKRVILYSLVPVFLLLLLLAVVEAGLRLFTDPAPFRLVNQVTYDRRSWLQINRSYLTKYFPANSPLIPEFKPTLVSFPKPSGCIRVLCLGESSMFGTPYHASATIPSILQKQLRRIFPDREVEVINLGASAINTNVIRDVVPQTVALEPDVVLIYTGHNEFYGPDGVGASLLEQQLPFLTRWKYALRDLRMVRLVQSWLRNAWIARSAGAEQNLMRQVSEGAHVQSGSPAAERVFRLFRENLQAILSFYQSHNIPVIVSDVTSNHCFPPFAHEPVQAAASAPRLIQQGRVGEAQSLLLASRPPDSANAFVEYWLGQAAMARSDSAGARPLLQRSIDDDLLKFRAPSRTDSIIIDVCRALAVPAIHADSAIAAACPGNIPGPSLFWEHLHLRAEGYYRIADLFLRELLFRRIVPADDPAAAFAARIPFQTDSLSISWLDQALADVSVKGITGRWPFQNYAVKTAVFDDADTALQRVAVAVYERRMDWNEGCLRTAAWFTGHQRAREAETSYEALLEDFPGAYLVRYLLANLLKDNGRIDDAVKEYARTIETNPSYPFPRVELGLLLINQGRFDQAAGQLSTALRLADSLHAPATLKATALYGLSAAAANEGNYAEAVNFINSSLRLVPSYGPALALKAQLERIH